MSSEVMLGNGRMLDPWAPAGDAPPVEVVSAACARLCRYGGHVSRFYSVLEHEVWCAVHLCSPLIRRQLARWLSSGSGTFVRLAAERMRDDLAASGRHGDALDLLLHDHPEGCGLVDVLSPVKRRGEMAGYREADARLGDWLAPQYGGRGPSSWSPVVDEVDRGICGAEMGWLKGYAAPDPAFDWLRPDLDVLHDGSPATQASAVSAWLLLYHELLRAGAAVRS